jgi:hypothetical protein
MRVNGATFMARIFHLLAGRSSGAFPSSRKFAISSSSLGTASTLNRFTSSKSSSIHVDLPLFQVGIDDPGSTFFFPLSDYYFEVKFLKE